jgi:sulfur carrier protein
MNLKINGEPKPVDAEHLTLTDLLERLDITQRQGVAVAINNAVVPKSEWDAHDIEDGDAIEIIRATQGG